MKLFTPKQQSEAIAYSARGKQAIYVKSVSFGGSARQSESMAVVAYLLDQNRERLLQTAHQLGIIAAEIRNQNRPTQNILLTRKALDKACARAKKDAKKDAESASRLAVT